MSDFISDSDMQRLEAAGHASAPAPVAHSADFISDEDMAKIPTDNDKALYAAGDHASNAILAGYQPQVVAGITKAALKVDDWLHGTHNSDNNSYSKIRDSVSKDLESEAQENPKSALAGTIVGSMAPAAAISRVVGPAAKGAGLAARALNAGLSAGVAGAVANPGDTEGEVDPLQLESRAKNAAVSAPLGGALHVTAEGVGALGGKIAGGLKDYAEEKAFKALGPFKRQVKQNMDRIKQIGRQALDDGVVGGMPTDAEGLAARASAAKEAAGQKIESVVNDLADQPGVPSVERKRVADHLRETLLGDERIPGVKAKNDYFRGLIDEFEQGGEDLSLKEARDLKGAVNKLIKWDRLPGSDVPIEEQFHRGLYSGLRQGEEDIASSLADSGAVKDGDALKNAKQAYGNHAEAEKIAENRATAQKANGFLGLKDAVHGATGATIGGFIGKQLDPDGHEGMKIGSAIGGGIGAFGGKLSGLYGNQLVAQGADKMAALARMSPKIAKLVQDNPALMPQISRMLGMKNEAATPQLPSSPISPEILDRVRNNPALLDTISNPQLKQAIRDRIGDPARLPSSDKPEQGIIPEEQAQKQFIEGNR